MAQGFQELIGKAVLDPQFRNMLFSNPDAAMQGFDLTPQQQAAVNNITPDQFQAAVDAFNKNLPGAGDDLLKKAIKKAIDLYKEMPGSDAFYKPQSAPGNDAFIKYGSDALYKEMPGSDALYKEMPGSDALIKGESYPGSDALIKGESQSGPSPHMNPAGNILGILIGLLLFLGLLLFGFFAFAPTGMVQGAMTPMMASMACPSDPSFGDGSVMPGEGELLPAVQVGDVNGVPAADVNGDGHSAPAGDVNGDEPSVAVGDVNGDGQALSVREAALAPSAFAKIEFSFFSFFNNMRMSFGGESFFDSSACMMEEEGQPVPPGETTGGDDQGGGTAPNQSTGGITGGSQGGGVTGGSGSDGTCGNNVCDPNENSDICPNDCQCQDNGQVDPGEGCGCKDVVCQDEGQASACGSACPTGVCGNGLTCDQGFCTGPLCPGQQPPPDTTTGGGNQSGGQQCTCECKVVCDQQNQCSDVCLDSCSGLKCTP